MDKIIRLVSLMLLVFFTSNARGSTVSKPIRMNVDSLPLSLDPTKVRDIVADWLLSQVGNRLVATHSDGTIKGDLAQSWRVVNGGERFEFVLRDDVKFSDGTPMTAYHVKANIDVAMRSHANFSFYLDRLQSVEAVDAHTVVFQLRFPMPSFLQVLGEPMFTVYKPCGNTFCFTGPYQIGKTDAKSIEIERLADGQVVRLQEMTFAEAFSAYKAGQLEILRSYGVGSLNRVAQLKNRQQLRFEDTLGYFVAINSQKDGLRTAGERSAVADAFDFGSAKQWLAANGVGMSSSFVSPTFFGSVAVESRQSGKALQRPLHRKPLHMIMIDSHEIEPLAQALKGSVPIVIESLKKKEFLRRAQAGDYDAILIGYSVTLRDIDYLSIFFDSKSLHNFARVNIPEADQLIEKAWLARSGEERRDAFRKLLELNTAQSLYIPLSHCPVIFTLADDIEQSESITGLNSTALNLLEIKWHK